VTGSLDVVVRLALDEDLGAGDVTSAATVPASRRIGGAVVARAPGVVAGLAAGRAVFGVVDPTVAVELLAVEGDRVASGGTVMRVEGPARSVLAAERTALNLICHLSGVATLTARYVAAVEGTGAVIRDTRKTVPGLRALQKAAVVAGGGHNHRMRLDDGLLVKDNHIRAAGGVAAAVRSALAGAAGLPVQVEVDTLEQLDEALAEGATAVLLDNFDPETLQEGVARCRARSRDVFVEASGGVTLANVRRTAEAGVDAIAVGAITHSAPALDLALDLG